MEIRRLITNCGTELSGWNLKILWRGKLLISKLWTSCVTWGAKLWALLPHLKCKRLSQTIFSHLLSAIPRDETNKGGIEKATGQRVCGCVYLQGGKFLLWAPVLDSWWLSSECLCVWLHRTPAHRDTACPRIQLRLLLDKLKTHTSYLPPRSR